MRKGDHARRLGTMDLILVLCGVFLLLFTVGMVAVFLVAGLEMSTLETCVFGAVAGECGVMGWIKTSKVRSKEREWEKADREEPPTDKIERT